MLQTTDAVSSIAFVIAAVTATVPKDVLRRERGGARAGAR
jgi:hypothetical protein